MQTISLPQEPKYTAIGEHFGKFEIDGCYPGYGATLGNALRRVLLSSLEGAAITSVKILNVSHEFSTLPGVLEDMVKIILNLKKVRFRMHGDDELVKITLKAKGEGAVCAEKIHTPSSLEIVNGDQLIATLTDKKAELELELTVERGLGYIAVEHQVRREKEIGVIAIDAIYTPIERVNYTVENMRVGKRTDFDRITLEVLTDGSITPEEAFQRAVAILMGQFSALRSEEVIQKEQEKLGDAEFGAFSARTRKVLAAYEIHTLSDIAALSEAEVRDFSGMGEKGFEEVEHALKEAGLSFAVSA
ncbi:MAG: DNA-directed RNA polymerase subunit alpha [Candidatus Moraniibacteriota bacterium]|nr:MAG: DNA-directed RNA polymerase subunit alpha [Candidatus Moranbacteria bacterium]